MRKHSDSCDGIITQRSLVVAGMMSPLTIVYRTRRAEKDFSASMIQQKIAMKTFMDKQRLASLPMGSQRRSNDGSKLAKAIAICLIATTSSVVGAEESKNGIARFLRFGKKPQPVESAPVVSQLPQTPQSIPQPPVHVHPVHVQAVQGRPAQVPVSQAPVAHPQAGQVAGDVSLPASYRSQEAFQASRSLGQSAENMINASVYRLDGEARTGYQARPQQVAGNQQGRAHLPAPVHAASSIQLQPASYCDQPSCPQPPPCTPKKQIHHVYVRPQCPTREEPANLPAQMDRPLPPGSYVAPPRSGTVVRQSSSTGITGIRLRFPAWEVSLPTIELPSMLRRERGARMELDTGTAPYVASAGQAATYSSQQAAMVAMPYAAGQYQAASMNAYQATQPRQQSANVQQQPSQEEAGAIDEQIQGLESKIERLETALLKAVECQKNAIETLNQNR